MNASQLDYEQTYDLIASVHLDAFRKTGTNPWMSLETIDRYHAATIALMTSTSRTGR